MWRDPKSRSDLPKPEYHELPVYRGEDHRDLLLSIFKSSPPSMITYRYATGEDDGVPEVTDISVEYKGFVEHLAGHLHLPPGQVSSALWLTMSDAFWDHEGPDEGDRPDERLFDLMRGSARGEVSGDELLAGIMKLGMKIWGSDGKLHG